MAPVVSVIVPVLDGARTIGALLDAVAAQVGAPEHEVIVVDNGSTDATPDVASSHPLAPRVVHEQRRGSYAARNTGIQSAHADILAFTDADCVPQPGWLAAGVAAFETGADLVGGAIAPLRSSSPSRWERYDRAMYLRQQDHVEDEGFAATANLFVRRPILEALGGFDASLLSGGDFDFGKRATAAGFRLIYSADAVVQHRPRTTLRETWKLHRRLGAGFAVLARRGQRPPPWRDRGLLIAPQWVAAQSGTGVDRLRVRSVVAPHVVAMAARWTGRLTGRG